MARIEITGFEGLERFLENLAQPKEMAVKAVNAASPIAEKSLKTEVRRAACRKNKQGKPYATGQLEASIGRTEARENQYGVFAVVTPKGKDKKGMRNAEKLAYLEYGVRSHGQLPYPVRQNAVNNAKTACEKAMEDTIYREVDAL